MHMDCRRVGGHVRDGAAFELGEGGGPGDCLRACAPTAYRCQDLRQGFECIAALPCLLRNSVLGDHDGAHLGVGGWRAVCALLVVAALYRA